MRLNLFKEIDDPFFLSIILALAVGGILLLSSASIAASQKLYGTISFFTYRQTISLLAGFAAFFVMQLISHKFWKRTAPFFFAGSLILLGLVFIPGIGMELQGAKRWIDLSFFTIQPAEIAKLTLVIFLAWWIERYRARISSFRYGFLGFLGIMALVGALVVMEPDLGTFGVMALAGFSLFFIGGAKPAHLVLLALIGLIGVVALSYATPYRLERFRVFFDMGASSDPQGNGYQIRQAAIAVGSGGFSGLGYGESRQKYYYLPEPIGDSIFAIVAEEFGFWGAGVVIFFFILLLWRGLTIARRAPDMFAKLLAAGIIIVITTQAFVNIGSITGLLPLTGIPLPFISYGGTSLVAALAGLGIVYQISKHS